MKTRFPSMLLIASLILALTGCANYSKTTTTEDLTPVLSGVTITPVSKKPIIDIDYDALKKVGIQFAVIKVTKNHPDRPAKIHAVVTEIRAVAGQDGFNTVVLLIDAIKLKTDYVKLEPEDKILADFLISEIERNLQDQLGFGIIPSDKLFYVVELCDLVDQSLGYPTPPRFTYLWRDNSSTEVEGTYTLGYVGHYDYWNSDLTEIKEDPYSISDSLILSRSFFAK